MYSSQLISPILQRTTNFFLPAPNAPSAILNYCSGNKLSYLNGEILAQLPQLHSLQLAGANPWICDCHLRKLVRQLVGNSTYGGALVREKSIKQPQQATTTTTTASILQDEPRCLRTEAAANGGGGADDEKPGSSGVSSVVGSSRAAANGRQMGKKEESRWSSPWTNMSKYNRGDLRCRLGNSGRPLIIMPADWLLVIPQTSSQLAGCSLSSKHQASQSATLLSSWTDPRDNERAPAAAAAAEAAARH